MKVALSKIRIPLVLLFVLLVVNFLAAQRVRDDAPAAAHPAPDGKGGQSGQFLHEARTHGAHGGNNGIFYHGGPVLHGSVPIYIIWYGNWTNGLNASDSSTTVNLLEAFLGATGGIGGSPYENINSTYFDNTGSVSGNLALSKAVFDSYSQGATLSDATLQAVVAAHTSATGDLPADASGVYLVLTSSDVNESSGFCTRYCGFHTRATLNGADIKYAFIGNVDRCPSGCEAQTTTPNNDSGADGMANVIAHETEEAISDPDLNAWFDRRGEENADKCNFNFGATQTAGNGSQFNQVFGGREFLIQQNWENANGGGCVQHFP